MSTPLLALVTNKAEATDDSPTRVVIACPTVGVWRGIPRVGDVVCGGQSLGHINTVGRWREVLLPPKLNGLALGRVVEVAASGNARRPTLAYGDVMVVLSADGLDASNAADVASAEAELGTVFVAPSSGRFYERPGPDKPAFVEVGQTIKRGDVVCIVEVMKTFTRVTFDGPTIPDRARITRIVPADGDDLEAGSPVIEFEASN